MAVQERRCALYLSNHHPKPTGAYLAFEMLYKRVNYIGMNAYLRIVKMGAVNTGRL
jgi:hypothetical protein